MSIYQYFYVDKNNQTFADELKMFGLARVLNALLFRQSNGAPYDVRISDCGSYYQLECDPPLEIATIEQYEGMLLPIKFIRTDKNESSLPQEQSQNWLNYEAIRDQVQAYYAAREKGGDAMRPDKHWDILRAINPAALPGYTNLLMNWWQIQPQLPLILRLLINLYSTIPNDVDGASAYWKQLDKEHDWKIDAKMTGQQLYNPDQGKGQNKTKSSGMSIGNMDGFWLEEYLKAVGFYEAALTKTVRGAKDRKSFVIAPRSLSYREHTALQSVFTNLMQAAEHSTRFDILAALRYSQTLLNYYLSEEQRGIEPWLADLEDAWSPRREVAGFRTAFYKDLGNAVATMNIAFIALPGWIRVSSGEEAGVYQALLTELIKIVQQFDETHSDAFTLLQHLRDFVSGDDLEAFFRFTNAFPAYYMGMRERNKPVRPLSTTLIERLVMSTDRKLSDILAAEGFQKIAYAIRQSTVTAQYHKKQGSRKYDVRYGLGQELARKARYPADFIVALGDFLHKYNAENAQVMETKNGPYRKSVTTADIDEVVALIDEFGSQTVANLLIAYGYARVPREDESTIEEQENE